MNNQLTPTERPSWLITVVANLHKDGTMKTFTGFPCLSHICCIHAETDSHFSPPFYSVPADARVFFPVQWCYHDFQQNFWQLCSAHTHTPKNTLTHAQRGGSGEKPLGPWFVGRPWMWPMTRTIRYSRVVAVKTHEEWRTNRRGVQVQTRWLNDIIRMSKSQSLLRFHSSYFCDWQWIQTKTCAWIDFCTKRKNKQTTAVTKAKPSVYKNTQVVPFSQ